MCNGAPFAVGMYIRWLTSPWIRHYDPFNSSRKIGDFMKSELQMRKVWRVCVCGGGGHGY